MCDLSHNLSPCDRLCDKSQLDLIRELDYSAFPPRLPEQPIFYPVLNQEYATQIARDWNAKYNQPKRGYVTKFEVRNSFLDRYEIRTVGSPFIKNTGSLLKICRNSIAISLGK